MLCAQEIMRDDVITLSPEDPLWAVGELMRLARLRQLPVVREGLLAGELSFKDVISAAIEDPAKDAPPPKVGDLMHRAEHLAAPGTGANQLVACIARRGVGFVPIVESHAGVHRLLGIVTEQDLLRRLTGPARADQALRSSSPTSP